MANCKACGQWFASTDPKCELCITCKRALERLKDYVAPVVRCKDCKWFGRDIGYGKHDCKKYEMPYCLENDFCSYGKRKTDD